MGVRLFILQIPFFIFMQNNVHSITIPEAFKELMEPMRIKVYYGGRGAAKSTAFADSLLVLGMQNKLRILCARELQVSVADSVHRLLVDQIEAHGLGYFYTVTQTSIRGANGTEFMFKGLRHNATEIKSTQGIDICWCFPAGTLVDEVPIETLREGDLVQSFNHATGEIELKPVLRAIKNTCPTTLIKILTSCGHKPILCTSEHPIFIKNKGYIPASEIKSGDIVYEKIELTGVGSMLGWLWRKYRNKFQRASRLICKEWGNSLFGLQEANIKGKFDKKQSDEQSCLPIKNVGSAEKSAQERGRWKWSWDVQSAKRIIRKAWSWLVAGACCVNKWISSSADKLQIGFSKCILHAVRRMRWEWPQGANCQRRGRKKKYVLAERRVDGIEIHKQDNIARNGRSDGGNYVYNIEVEGNNNYFAEGTLVHNCEEAERVSETSWELLIPTIRKEGSEIWISFNPRKPDDATYKRFILNKREDSIVRKVSYRDNPFFPSVLETERLNLLKSDPEAYDHIWEGNFDTRFFGGVYSKQMAELDRLGQLTDRVLHDPLFPVYTSWDLGFDDATAIWFYQVGNGEIFLIDYYEYNGEGVKHYLEVLCGRKIIIDELAESGDARWHFGEDIEEHAHRKDWYYAAHYVPHDAMNKVMAAGGRSIVEQAGKLGVRMECIPKTSVMNGIEALRMTLPRCWFNSERCARGITALLNYCFEYDEERAVFKNKPRHDKHSHAADAAEMLARVWREKAQTMEGIKTRKHEALFKRLRRENLIDRRDPYRIKPLRKK